MTKALLNQALDAMNKHGSPYLGHIEEYQAGVEALRAAIAQHEPDVQCYCDKHGIGVKDVSCGDCPTRDYKVQPEPEPVAWMTSYGNVERADNMLEKPFADKANYTIPLYDSPVQPVYVPLTKKQVDDIVYQCRQAGDDTTYAIVNAAIKKVVRNQS